METPKQHVFSVSKESTLTAEKIRLTKLLTEIANKGFYERLGITKDASNYEVTEAFKRNAVLFHPDNKPVELKGIYDRIFQLFSEAKSAILEEKERVGYNDRDKGMKINKEKNSDKYERD